MSVPRGDALEVWGDPIAHSRSPQLHRAAYAVLGTPWTYERRRVDVATFARELDSLGSTYRGLSLTFPLKGVAFEASARLDRRAELTGAVNTLVFGEADGPAGFNTDVGGIVAALQEAGADRPGTARVVGAGATATSAIVALAELGVAQVEVVARRPETVARLARLGDDLRIRVRAAPLDQPTFVPVPVTIATLPGDAPLDPAVADALSAGGGLLLDVVYGHWPTTLAQAWERAGMPAINGLGMLLHQAVLQVRAFSTGRIDEPLAREERMLAAMRAAVVGD